jgi:hypothetical protein
MKKFNGKIGASSQARLNRIESLLKENPFTKEKFIVFAQDHSNGPGNKSICRHFEAGVRGSERKGQLNIVPNYRCLAPIFHGLTIYKWRKYDRMLLGK